MIILFADSVALWIHLYRRGLEAQRQTGARHSVASDEQTSVNDSTTCFDVLIAAITIRLAKILRAPEV